MRLIAALTLSAVWMVAAEKKPPKNPAALFDATRIWSVDLKFSADQWAEMQPTGGPPMGAPGGMRGPGGPGAFGPSMLVMPAFLKGDKDGDGKLSGEEFRALGEGWFLAWDEAKAGKVTEAQLRKGLGISIPMPTGMFGGMPGRGPGGPGGPGRPGGGLTGPEGGRNGVSGMMGIDFKYAHASINFNGRAFQDVAVRYKGNGTYMQSRGALKQSFKVDLNKYVKGQKIAGVTTLNLHSNVTDATSMNEPVSYRLFRDGVVPAPRTSYARVYLTVAGKYEKQYLGLYSVVENVDEEMLKDRYSSIEGAIFKPSTRNLFGYLGDDWKKYKQMYDPKTELTAAQKQRVMDFAKLVTSGSDSDFESQIASYLELDEVARYLAINVWLANMDSILAMGQNYYLFLNAKTNRFQIWPWDLDLAFGGMGGGTELSIEHPWRGENRFLERLFAVPAFKKIYMARMGEFQKTIFEPGRISKQVDETAVLIRAAVKEESEDKVGRFEKSVAGEVVPRGGAMGPGGPGRGPGGFGGLPIKAFVGPRAKSVAAQLSGESKGESSGGGMGMGGPPGGFGPANFIAPVFMRTMDEDKDGNVSKAEFDRCFAKWFAGWSGGASALTEAQLKAGIDKVFGPPPGMMPPL